MGKREPFFRRLGRALVGGKRSGVIRVARPFDVAAVTPDRLFVSDGLTRGLLLFDRGHKDARLVGTDVPGGLLKPMGIGAGGGGSVLLADQAARRVVVLGPDGRFLRAFGDTTTLLNPVDVAADTTAGRFYVVDSYQHQVLVFGPAGELIQRLGKTSGDRTGARPSGIQDGAPPHAGHPLGPGERPRTRDVVGNRGEAPGEFKYPGAVAVGADGMVYVSDQMNFRVQAFDRTGNIVRVIGQVGTLPGSFARPKGVAVDSQGHLYVVDAAFGNVQLFQADGSLLLPFAGGGAATGGPILPLGIATDGLDRIYLADRFNNRILIYEYLR
jgi:DNA-binding beta-propeller fold protein YncE